MATETRVQKQLIFGWEQITEPFLHPLWSLGGLTQPGNSGCSVPGEPGKPQGITWGATHGSCPHHSPTNSKTPGLKGQRLGQSCRGAAGQLFPPCSGSPEHIQPQLVRYECISTAEAFFSRKKKKKPSRFLPHSLRALGLPGAQG